MKQPLNKFTFKAPLVKKWVEEHCKGKVVINLFAGSTELEGCEEIRNDIDVDNYAHFHKDALDFIRWWSSSEQYITDFYRSERLKKVDIILLDPPYSYRKSMELYNGHLNSRFKLILDEIPKILKEDGKVITFGYHASVMSKCRGFKVDEILLIDHSGAQHTTLACVESRI